MNKHSGSPLAQVENASSGSRALLMHYNAKFHDEEI